MLIFFVKIAEIIPFFETFFINIIIDEFWTTMIESQNISSCLTLNVENAKCLVKFNFSNLYGKCQHLLDSSQISWDFATNILKFSENDFRKVRKKLENILEIRKKSVLTRS